MAQVISSGSPTPAQCQEFYRSHYSLIAEHATQLTRSRWTYVQLSLFGVAVFYSHLFSAEQGIGRTSARDWLLILPIALAVFGGVQSWAISWSIIQRNNILKEIEKHYKLNGWAHNVAARGKSLVKNPVDSLIFVYWIMLFIFTSTLAGAIWLGCLSV